MTLYKGITMLDQKDLEQEILDYLNGVYSLLIESDKFEASEVLGLVAEAKAIWENDTL